MNDLDAVLLNKKVHYSYNLDTPLTCLEFANKSLRNEETPFRGTSVKPPLAPEPLYPVVVSSFRIPWCISFTSHP